MRILDLVNRSCVFVVVVISKRNVNCFEIHYTFVDFIRDRQGHKISQLFMRALHLFEDFSLPREEYKDIENACNLSPRYRREFWRPKQVMLSIYFVCVYIIEFNKFGKFGFNLECFFNHQSFNVAVFS